MAVSFSSSKINHFKREAKRLSREHSIPHSEALDRIAVQHGFKNWSLLAKHGKTALAINAPSPIPHEYVASNQDRYYLHGDQREDNPALFYCARCDEFTKAEHFDDLQLHQGETHDERYLNLLDRWNQRPSASKTNWYRPADVINILANTALSERSAREAARSPFHRWLLTQVDRDDPVGDLAEDARRDERFPTGANNLRELERYLSRYGDDVVQALRKAWGEFSTLQPT